MSPAFLVAAILTLAWNLTLVVAAVLTETGPFQSGRRAERTTHRVLRTVRAEVGTPEIDARTNAWRRGASGGVTEYVRSRIAETSCEIEAEVPFAEASVVVETDEGSQARRCSVCMN